jgi:hypothetical protein
LPQFYPLIILHKNVFSSDGQQSSMASGAEAIQNYGEEGMDGGNEVGHFQGEMMMEAESTKPRWALIIRNKEYLCRFVAGQWGQCSTSCGPGIRPRPVDCMGRQAISGQPIKLPDFECQGGNDGGDLIR